MTWKKPYDCFRELPRNSKLSWKGEQFGFFGARPQASEEEKPSLTRPQRGVLTRKAFMRVSEGLQKENTPPWTFEKTCKGKTVIRASGSLRETRHLHEGHKETS
jgi:hypothetical protein